MTDLLDRLGGALRLETPDVPRAEKELAVEVALLNRVHVGDKHLFVREKGGIR